MGTRGRVISVVCWSVFPEVGKKQILGVINEEKKSVAAQRWVHVQITKVSIQVWAGKVIMSIHSGVLLSRYILVLTPGIGHMPHMSSKPTS